MSIRIKLESVLIYHDVPVLFVGIDNIKTNYLCQLVEKDVDEDIFICVQISKKRLKSVLMGSIDLREAFINPEIPSFYKLPVANYEDMVIKDAPLDSIDSKWLSDEGLFVNEFLDLTEKISHDDKLFNVEAKAKKTAIFHLSLDVPEAANEALISSQKLIQILSMIQSLVKNSFKKVITTFEDSKRRVLDDPNNYALEVYGFSEGSFNIHIKSKTNADLFGDLPIERAFRLIDEITNHIDDVDANVETVKKYKGRLAKSYINIMKFIIENQTSIKYRWTVPGDVYVSHRSISKESAKPIYEELIKTEEIGAETIEIVGKVIKVDIKSGSWTIQSIEDNKHYSGILYPASTVSLEGITVGTIQYKFICEEVVELDGTGREKPKLFLQSYDEVN
ncbi:hypothetical protein MCHI_001114 [Candidatus Magnetoovum chiemensis]|nr:hypothetical protein MCHI_001114 [Candidatus Magnetoovum chiemensis]